MSYGRRILLILKSLVGVVSTVLDDFSRYIIAWQLFTSMTASDVKEILDEAVSNTGVNHIQVKHRPRLLSDNGPCYLSG
jgi:putative transposase